MVQLGLGAVVGFAGVTIPRLTDPASEDLILDAQQVALYASLVGLGAMAGCFISSVAQVRLGQRRTMLMFLPAELLSWLLLIFTPSAELLLVARFLLGFFVGAMGAAAYTYVVEISYKDHRGGLVSIVDLVRQCGMLLAYILGSLTLTWRMMAVILACLSTILPFIFLIFLPDSPRYLAFRKELDSARDALKLFRGRKYDVEPELTEIVEQLNRAGSQGTVIDQFYQLLKLENLKIFILLTFLNFIAQFTGNFVVINYTVPIFQATNSSIDAYTSTIIIGVIRVIGSSTYLIVIDRFGRRLVFIFSFLVMATSGAIFGGYFFLQSQNYDVNNIGWLPLTCLVVFSFFTCIGHPVVTVLRGELLPTSARSLGFNLLTSILFLGTFSVSQTYPTFVSALGIHGTFWIYSCCSVVLSIVVALFVPETKDKSLEEIQNKK
ncbi:unnamed protein product [Meganyctiphanes norvegica]|uniref:Major facilitator superfamily (MFS) profile domain-containing protein n=1 Tax=Meganyctiphanes norvegica TaxID=48144 RepID=A0AAV2QHN0_MEGNR